VPSAIRLYLTEFGLSLHRVNLYQSNRKLFTVISVLKSLAERHQTHPYSIFIRFMSKNLYKQERQVYVPRGRRELPASDISLAGSSVKTASMLEQITSSSSSSTSKALPVFSRPMEMETEEFIPNELEKLAGRTLIAYNVPRDLSESRKGLLVQRYVDNGANARWITPTICMLVFASDSLAARSLNMPSTSFEFSPRLIFDSPYYDHEHLSSKHYHQYY